MSFSIELRAASKAALVDAVTAKLAEIAAADRAHAKDCDHAAAAAAAYVNTLADDETKDVAITMNGSLSGEWQEGQLVSVHGAALSIYAKLATREPQAS